MRLLIGLVMAAFALFSYFRSSVYNPVTGEQQHINITAEQEIALGLQSAPQMAAQFGGLHPDQRAQALVDAVGQRLVQSSAAAQTPYPFEFSLLADEQTVNAFALPGGPIFITAALFERLQTEGQLAGVLGHEIGHVVARHSAEHIAKQQLTQGLTGALVLSTYDPDNPGSRQTAQIARVVGQLLNMKYGREDELESDRLGVRFLADAGYDPRALIGVMQILAEAGAGARQPEFFSTHPNPENRIAQIEAAIQERFPQGVPEGLRP
ncbi:MAG: M48 family metalloprotease [candidate division KSB1 bacterium]|nr:M48 family metalloprotease [candidate division KSB1 bacterium]MDZ7274598.1 M48 family metalloprotease [candidate division KSB1 bacterium]MDZ7284741.1 M48 family metalloprotease [candidate division KSB1 bacterium]MDZ7297839.1 M48 family metalloprotease [candidate division KSB1 bacterium]MDZ7308880.1 M48 family metalloprotease [candidate division KSB1 bacterium]